MLNRQKQKNKGFTLIEMLISIALFSVVTTIVIGSILTIVDSNRKSQSLAIVMNNLNFAIESMTRDIKTANPTSNSVYGTIMQDSFSNTTLTLEDSDGREIVYGYDGDNQTITKNIDGAGAKTILSNDIVIEEFFVDVLRDPVMPQPRAFLYIRGYTQISEKTRSDFSIQTTVSPRKLNIY